MNTGSRVVVVSAVVVDDVGDVIVCCVNIVVGDGCVDGNCGVVGGGVVVVVDVVVDVEGVVGVWCWWC